MARRSTRRSAKKAKPKRSSGRAWTLERAVRRVRGSNRKVSNRYSGGDSSRRPKPGTRKFYWHPRNRRLQRNPWFGKAKKR
jgi:hypothetical protein